MSYSVKDTNYLFIAQFFPVSVLFFCSVASVLDRHSPNVTHQRTSRYTFKYKSSYVAMLSQSVKWLDVCWTIGIRVSLGAGFFLFITTFRAALGPVQLLICWIPAARSLRIKRPDHEADQSPLYRAKFKNACSLNSASECAYRSWCLGVGTALAFLLIHVCSWTRWTGSVFRILLSPKPGKWVCCGPRKPSSLHRLSKSNGLINRRSHISQPVDEQTNVNVIFKR
jgi:hypothetical protein